MTLSTVFILHVHVFACTYIEHVHLFTYNYTCIVGCYIILMVSIEIII